MLNSKRKDAIKTSNPTIKLYFFYLFRSTTSLFHCTQGKRYQYNVKTFYNFFGKIYSIFLLP